MGVQNCKSAVSESSEEKSTFVFTLPFEKRNISLSVIHWTITLITPLFGIVHFKTNYNYRLSNHCFINELILVTYALISNAVEKKKRKLGFHLRCNTTVTKWRGWFFDLSPILALLMAELILSQVECPAAMHPSVSQSIHKLCFVYYYSHSKIFSSPEPLGHGELLWSLDVRRASSVVSNCFKGHLLLNYWLDFDQTW